MIHPRHRLLALVAVALMSLGLIATPTAYAEVSPPKVAYAATGNPSGKEDARGNAVRAPRSSSTPFKASPPPTWEAECPKTIKCVVVPAAYSANNGDVGDYGNYDDTNRPADMRIDGFLIHETEGELQSVLDLFQSPTAYVSCHYVIDVDGTVYQMVQMDNTPWHAGNWWFNMHKACIEVIGHAAAGNFTEAQYNSTVALINYWSPRLNLPQGNCRGVVMGHDNVPATTPAGIPRMHNDMGPYWNWQKLCQKLTKGSAQQSSQPLTAMSNFATLGVKIAPIWPLHRETVTGCSGGGDVCVPPGTVRPVNFVYLKSAPSSVAPLFTDPILGQGTTDINNNAARIFWGQTFAVTGYKLEFGGVWLKVNVNGAPAWFYSPWNAPTALPSLGDQYVTPRGDISVPTFGRAIPERSEYPPDLLAVPPGSWYVPTPTPLGYEVKPGQKYKVLDASPPTEHLYIWAIDGSFPHDGTVFKGKKRYFLIELGGRQAFVPADEVMVS